MLKEEAIDLFGSASALAEVLGISRQAVNMWGETIPEMRAWQIRSIMDNGGYRDDVIEAMCFALARYHYEHGADNRDGLDRDEWAEKWHREYIGQAMTAYDAYRKAVHGRV